MPYFKWYGVDIAGISRNGKLFATSYDHLDRLLFKRGIALLKTGSEHWGVYGPIRLSSKIQFFRQLGVLLDAGVLLSEALELVAAQLEHPKMQALAYGCADGVQQGIHLSTLLQRSVGVFGPLAVQLVRVG